MGGGGAVSPSHGHAGACVALCRCWLAAAHHRARCCTCGRTARRFRWRCPPTPGARVVPGRRWSCSARRRGQSRSRASAPSPCPLVAACAAPPSLLAPVVLPAAKAAPAAASRRLCRLTPFAVRNPPITASIGWLASASPPPPKSPGPSATPTLSSSGPNLTDDIWSDDDAGSDRPTDTAVAAPAVAAASVLSSLASSWSTQRCQLRMERGLRTLSRSSQLVAPTPKP